MTNAQSSYLKQHFRNLDDKSLAEQTGLTVASVSKWRREQPKDIHPAFHRTDSSGKQSSTFVSMTGEASTLEVTPRHNETDIARAKVLGREDLVKKLKKLIEKGGYDADIVEELRRGDNQFSFHGAR